MNFDLDKMIRPNIKNLTAYSSARKEFSGAAQIFLDANENNFGSPLPTNYNRYPDPLQSKIKEKIASLNKLEINEIFIGNGSDEAIDLLFRIFCEPRRDNVLICPPTYGMYRVAAEINDVEVKCAKLNADFQINLKAIENESDELTKIIFICSPNNPTGNAFPRREILRIVEKSDKIVAVDEAYIHFSREKSMIEEIRHFPNLVILQTFSKAWGLAGLRVGTAFANAEIIKLFNKVKPPYNISEIAQEKILTALDNEDSVRENIAKIISERKKLNKSLRSLSFIEKIYPTEANFFLAKTTNANRIYQYLLENNIVVRNRNNVELCENCLRITIGKPEENQFLVDSLQYFDKLISETAENNAAFGTYVK